MGDDRRDAGWLVRLMAEMDAYRDKEIVRPTPEPDGGPGLKAVVVEWLPGERVRLVGGDPDEWGVVTGLTIRPGCATYRVAWPETRTSSRHYAVELEGAGEA